MARTPKPARGVLRVALDLVERWYRRRAGARLGRGGSVTAIQRFGSDLRLNMCFHVVALDGVYERGADCRLSFRRAVPRTVDIEWLVLEIAEGCEVWLERQGFGADEEVDPEEEDSLSLLQRASVGGMSRLKRVPASDALKAGDSRRLDSSLGESPACQPCAPPSPA